MGAAGCRQLACSTLALLMLRLVLELGLPGVAFFLIAALK